MGEQGAYVRLYNTIGVLIWDVLLICLQNISILWFKKRNGSFLGQVYPIRFHEEEQQLPFPYQCNSCLAHVLLLPGKSCFSVQKPLDIYCVKLLPSL